MNFSEQMCYASYSIAIDIYKNDVFTKKCCINDSKIDVEKLDSVEDLTYLNNKLFSLYKIQPTSNPICNGLKECKKVEKISNLSVNVPGCNLSCYMCPCSAKPDNESKNTYFRILNSIKNFNLDYLALSTGGEPFLWKKETLDYLLSIDTQTSKKIDITTNGTLLNEEDIEILKKVKTKLNIIVSISHITNEGYQNIHRNSNFEKVLKNVELLKRAGLLQWINVVICQYNVQDLEKIVSFWKEKGIDINFMIIRESNENIENSPYFLDFKNNHKNWDYISAKE